MKCNNVYKRKTLLQIVITCLHIVHPSALIKLAQYIINILADVRQRKRERIPSHRLRKYQYVQSDL